LLNSRQIPGDSFNKQLEGLSIRCLVQQQQQQQQRRHRYDTALSLSSTRQQ